VEPVPRRRYQPGPLLAECHRPARSQAPVCPKWTHGRRVVASTAPAGSATCVARYRPTSHGVALVTVIHSDGRELARSALCRLQPQKKKRPGCSLPAGSLLFGAYRIIRRTPTSTVSTAATTPSIANAAEGITRGNMVARRCRSRALSGQNRIKPLRPVWSDRSSSASRPIRCHRPSPQELP
jgi:hypothetical protein